MPPEKEISPKNLTALSSVTDVSSVNSSHDSFETCRSHGDELSVKTHDSYLPGIISEQVKGRCENENIEEDNSFVVVSDKPDSTSDEELDVVIVNLDEFSITSKKSQFDDKDLVKVDEINSVKSFNSFNEELDDLSNAFVVPTNPKEHQMKNAANESGEQNRAKQSKTKSTSNFLKKGKTF